MGRLVWVGAHQLLHFEALLTFWYFLHTMGKYEWSSKMIQTLGFKNPNFKLKHVLSSYINNINHLRKFHAHVVVSSLIKIVAMLTFEVFSGVPFTWPNFTDNA